VEVLAVVDTTWQRDFGGMRVLQGHKGGKYKRSRVGLESGGKDFWRVMGRPYLRCVIHVVFRINQTIRCMCISSNTTVYYAVFYLLYIKHYYLFRP